jgi:ABC-type transport system substrate-binding protein
MLSPWEHNERITVERNTRFHGTPGIVEQIEIRIYSDTETSYREFRADNLDIARLVPAEHIAEARELGDRFLSTPIAALTYIGFPTALAPFDDVDLRRALSLAIDREAISERVYQGAFAPANGVVPSAAPGALSETCEYCVFDAERAKELFEKAGGASGDTYVLYDISDDGQEFLEPIINSWRDVLGVEVEVRSFEFAQYLEETAPDALEGPFELGWVWDYPSGYSILSPLFRSDSGTNNLGWANEDSTA